VRARDLALVGVHQGADLVQADAREIARAARPQPR